MVRSRKIPLVLAAAAPLGATALCATPEACALIGAFMLSVILVPCSVALTIFVFVYSNAVKKSSAPSGMYPVLLAAAPSALNTAVVGWWTVNVGLVLADNGRWPDLWWLFAVDAAAFCLAVAATGVAASAALAAREGRTGEETRAFIVRNV